MSRISFNDQGGKPHSFYQFNHLPDGLVAKASGMKSALALDITQPVLNEKRPINASGKFGVGMTNNSNNQIRVALNFCLPAGISVDSPERFYDIGPGGKKATILT